jgi:UDP-glucose 4-epimerase
MARKKLLITGGLGNLGSWITQDALEKFDVTVLARTHRDVQIDGDFTLILADLANRVELLEVLKGLKFSYVIHAGSVNDGFVDGYSSISYTVNSFGTRNLIEALELDSLEHFIYLSTFQVYGVYAGKIDEQTVAHPKNDYGMSHLLAEYFLAMDMPASKFSIIRLTNSYGCPKDMDSSKWYLVLNDLSRSAVANKEIKLSGNGKAVRDFIWMSDVSHTLLSLLAIDARNEVYNLSKGEVMSMLDIAKKVHTAYLQYYGASIPIKLNDDDSSNPDQSLVVCSSRLRDRLNIVYEDKFVEESIEIFKFLENSN